MEGAIWFFGLIGSFHHFLGEGPAPTEARNRYMADVDRLLVKRPVQPQNDHFSICGSHATVVCCKLCIARCTVGRKQQCLAACVDMCELMPFTVLPTMGGYADLPNDDPLVWAVICRVYDRPSTGKVLCHSFGKVMRTRTWYSYDVT